LGRYAQLLPVSRWPVAALATGFLSAVTCRTPVLDALVRSVAARDHRPVLSATATAVTHSAFHDSNAVAAAGWLRIRFQV
jgi:hypothetical protein